MAAAAAARAAPAPPAPPASRAPAPLPLDTASLGEAAVCVARLLERPEWLLDPAREEARRAAESARHFAKVFFDAAQAFGPRRSRQGRQGVEVGTALGLPLGGLVVNGFDHDQIWEELEVQNVPLRRHLRRRLAKLLEAPKGAVDLRVAGAASGATAEPGDAEKTDEVEAGALSPGPAAAIADGTSARGRKKRRGSAATEEPTVALADGEGADGTSDKERTSDGEGRKKQERDFFSAKDMKQFADLGDQGKLRLDEEAADDSDFGILDAVDDGAEDDDVNEFKFADFFDPPPAARRREDKTQKTKTGKDAAADEGNQDNEDVGDGSADEEDEEEEEPEIGGEANEDEELSDEEKKLEAKLRQLQAAEGTKPRKARACKDDEGSEEEGEEESEEEREDDQEQADALTGSKTVSLYEMDKRLRTLGDEVAKLEEEQLEEKPWAMRGEVNAKQRPLNSLLEMHLDQPMSHFAGQRARDALGATPAAGDGEDADALEDVPGADAFAEVHHFDVDSIIRQRVWDETFDDIVRKAELPPALRPHDKDKDVVETLNFEKSRVGLGDIYAQQYEAELLGHQTGAEKKEDKNKNETKVLFAKVMFKLDQLTNAHFTPRPPMMGVSGDQLAKAPSLKMEETIPLLVSDAHLKAPEELKTPRRHEREQGELTHDERIAARRAKKTKRRRSLEQKVEAGQLSLKGLRERGQRLAEKNEEAKREKASKGAVRDPKTRLKSSELLTQAAENAAAGASRKDAQRKERQKQPEGGLSAKRLKL